MNKNLSVLIIPFLLLFITNDNLYSQLLKIDDFTYKSDYWVWRSDGNQEKPTVENGLLKLQLKNALNSKYCNTEIYDPTKPYLPGTQVRIRLKCSPIHFGSRGWGFWDGKSDANEVKNDFDVAWIMQQGSDNIDYNWFSFGTSGDSVNNRNAFNLFNVTDETQWHTYNIVWRSDSTFLFIDGLPIFVSTSHLPDENMRVDLWIDNGLIDIKSFSAYRLNNTEGSEMYADFIEISGIDGPAINRHETGNILLWDSPNTFPNGAEKNLWKQYNFTTSNSGEALVFLTASAEAYGEIENDDDLRIVIDNNDFGWDSEKSFDGDQLKGKGNSIAFPVDLNIGQHKLDIYSDITPFLRDVIVIFSPNGEVRFNKKYNETAKGNDGLWKNIQFNSDSNDEVTILISGTGLENDEIQIELDNKSFTLQENKSIDGKILQGLPNTVILTETLTSGSHTLKLLKKGNPELYSVVIYGSPTITSIEHNSIETIKLSLESNPNPFNVSTKITYQIPEASHIKMRIINLLGQEITTLVNDFRAEGKHTKVWNANNENSGIYFCVLESDNYIKVSKLLLLK